MSTVYRKVFVTLHTGVVHVLFLIDEDVLNLKGIKGKNISFNVNHAKGGTISILGTDIISIGVD